MNRFLFYPFFLLASCFLLPVSLFPADEIQIEKVSIEPKALLRRYELAGTIRNTGTEPRDLILRGQISFYDKAAPRGDLAVMILRKDMFLVLKAGESREIKFDLLNEGAIPKGSLRPAPSVRVRRNREWNY